MNKRDSEIFYLIRFPLAFMVVMLHSYVAVEGFHISKVNYESLTGVDVYSLVGITFSHVLTQIAVPMFFFISGYLFFKGLESWNLNSFGSKLRRRLKSLLIPYLIWNTIQALVIIGVMILAYLLMGKSISRISEWFCNIGYFYGVYWSDQTTVVLKENMLGLPFYKSFPLLMPMWFIRDLMVTVLLAPILWLLLKKIPLIILAVLSFLWATGTGTAIPGLSFSSLLFFGLGGGAFYEFNEHYRDIEEDQVFCTNTIVCGITCGKYCF